jgi:ribonuclease HI
MIEIYTDGSCKGNPGEGGWGYVVVEDEKVITTNKGSEYHTTNNRMEITALLESLKVVEQTFGNNKVDVKIYTDSSYVANAFNQGWLEKWKGRGWINSEGIGVMNSDIWKKVSKYQLFLDVQVEKIPRRFNKFNIMADKLAREGAKIAKKEISFLERNIR